jgi:hypothetical protein
VALGQVSVVFLSGQVVRSLMNWKAFFHMMDICIRFLLERNMVR